MRTIKVTSNTRNAAILPTSGKTFDPTSLKGQLSRDGILLELGAYPVNLGIFNYVLFTGNEIVGQVDAQFDTLYLRMDDTVTDTITLTIEES